MSFIIEFSILAVLVVVHSVFGLGLLLFGTPTFLLLGYDFANTLNILMPVSITISGLQFFKSESKDKNFVSNYNLYCLPFLALFLAQVNAQIWHKKQENTYLIQAQYNLRDGVLPGDSYFQEALILQSYFAFLLDAKVEQKELMQRALDFDPVQNTLIKENIYIHPKVLDFNLIANWCLSMFENKYPFVLP